MRFELTGGDVAVLVKREGDAPITETVSPGDFGGAEDGPGFERDGDGVWSYGGIFKAFREDYTVVLEVAFVEYECRKWSVFVEDVTVISAVVTPESEDLTYELDYTDSEKV